MSEYDKTPNGSLYGWCIECGKEMSEYDSWNSQGHHCAECFSMIGIYHDSYYVGNPFTEPKGKPIIKFVPHGGGHYNSYLNIIIIDGFIRNFEDVLNHEYIHYVLQKLFPKDDVSSKYDNIAKKIEEAEKT